MSPSFSFGNSFGFSMRSSSLKFCWWTHNLKSFILKQLSLRLQGTNHHVPRSQILACFFRHIVFMIRYRWLASCYWGILTSSQCTQSNEEGTPDEVLLLFDQCLFVRVFQAFLTMHLLFQRPSVVKQTRIAAKFLPAVTQTAPSIIRGKHTIKALESGTPRLRWAVGTVSLNMLIDFIEFYSVQLKNHFVKFVEWQHLLTKGNTGRNITVSW